MPRVRAKKRKPDPLEIVEIQASPVDGFRWRLNYGESNTQWSRWYTNRLTALIDATKAAEAVSKWR